VKLLLLRVLVIASVLSLSSSIPSVVSAQGAPIAADAQPSPAQSSQGGTTVKTGYLTCNVAKGWGWVLGTSKDIKCVFSSTNGRSERYTGRITKVGVDIGYLSSAVMLWGVLAPSSNVPAGALAGNYGGVTGSAAVGYGAGASVLIGGFKHSMQLEPISISGQKGLNVAAGVEALTLHYAGAVQNKAKSAAESE
jgi:hypothetical protein